MQLLRRAFSDNLSPFSGKIQPLGRTHPRPGGGRRGADDGGAAQCVSIIVEVRAPRGAVVAALQRQWGLQRQWSQTRLIRFGPKPGDKVKSITSIVRLSCGLAARILRSAVFAAGGV